MDLICEMESIFEKSNQLFLKEQIELIESKVSERSLCSELKVYLINALKNTKYKNYHVDTEYNRNKNGTIKTVFSSKVKTIITPNENSGIPEPISICCDLIVHSRGKTTKQDNLIAVEMKKSYRSIEEKMSDRKRLVALTKNSFDDVWSFDGETLPEHVCRYVLGVYYEINLRRRSILIEYYAKGDFFREYSIHF